MNKLFFLTTLSFLSFYSFSSEYFARIENNHYKNHLSIEINFDELGFDNNGIHKDTGDLFDENGFNKDGIHRDTGTNLDPIGMDINEEYHTVFFPYNGVIQGTSINMNGNDYNILSNKKYFGSYGIEERILLVFDNEIINIGLGRSDSRFPETNKPFITSFVLDGFLYTWDSSDIKYRYTHNSSISYNVTERYPFSRIYVGK